MDEIRCVSIVKILQFYVIITSGEYFVMNFLNTDTCVKIHIIVHSLYGHMFLRGYIG